MKPYYQDKWVTIYHGDCREILPELAIPFLSVDLLCTDPVWPGCKWNMPGRDEARELLIWLYKEACQLTQRLILIMGCDVDVRLLSGVPSRMPFFTVCWLKRTPPIYKGKLLYSADVAYIFGENYPGHLLSSEITGPSLGRKEYKNTHPAPRNLRHIRQLVSKYTAEGWLLLDPFMGSGTLIQAAREANRRCIGIDVKEEYCEIAARRCSQEIMELKV